MKIGIAQTKSEKGNVLKNIQNHLKLVNQAVKHNADLIVFPELSITNYEPELAEELAANLEDEIFNPFQELSDSHQITIAIGMPTKSENGIRISMLIFQPHCERQIYSKQILHSDELPYFVSGNDQAFINIDGVKIGLGICYESLQPEHFIHAKNQGIDLYIASVAKPKAGIEKANKHFPKMAKAYKTPILMSNCVGYCDNFMSTGNSAIWNQYGESIDQLDEYNQGLLVFDTLSERSERIQPTIEKATLTDLEELFQIYQNGKAHLEKQNIYQWTANYPTRSIIENDLNKGVLYVLKNEQEILGAINISEEQETEYQLINWQFDDTQVLVIHRLVIDPKHQNQGYAGTLMDFAERYAQEYSYTSIRLDAYSQNERVIDFYKKRHFVKRGKVNFPERAFPFHCMEKEVPTY